MRANIAPHQRQGQACPVATHPRCGQVAQASPCSTSYARSNGRRLHQRLHAVKERSGLAELAELRALRNLKLDTELKDLELRDVNSVSYVSRRRLDSADFDRDEVDEDGLPLVYNEERIAQFWSKRPGELASRWGNFAAISAPWLTGLANAAISGRLQVGRAAGQYSQRA